MNMYVGRKSFGRKLSLALLATLFTFIALPAHGDTPVIRITDVPHTNFDGTFRNNDLVMSLTPEGKLGKALFNGNLAATWVIDAALLDEVIDMSDGYLFNGQEDPVGASVAQIWLQQLKLATIGSPIVALPYGNPDASLSRKLHPGEYRFYTTIGREKLEAFFGRPVISQNGWGTGKSRLSKEFQALYKGERALIAGLSTVIDAPEIPLLRARLSRVLNPLLSSKERSYFSYAARDATDALGHKLRVVSGRYQLTSENVKVPLTLVNDFDSPTVVSLSLIPATFRVLVPNMYNITIPPKSHIQISVPFTVVAPGSTTVEAQFLNDDGDPVASPSTLHLSLTVIDSRVAWFTTGAAILLFLGAVAQSVRRVRRSRHEK
jgi:hypothetical protein